QKVSSARSAIGPAGANDSAMIRSRVDPRLSEPGAVELGEIDMPIRGWIEKGGSGSSVIDHVHSSIVGRNPRKDCGSSGSTGDGDGRSPVTTLIARARE